MANWQLHEPWLCALPQKWVGADLKDICRIKELKTQLPWILLPLLCLEKFVTLHILNTYFISYCICNCSLYYKKKKSATFLYSTFLYLVPTNGRISRTPLKYREQGLLNLCELLKGHKSFHEVVCHLSCCVAVRGDAWKIKAFDADSLYALLNYHMGWLEKRNAVEN